MWDFSKLQIQSSWMEILVLVMEEESFDSLRGKLRFSSPAYSMELRRTKGRDPVQKSSVLIILGSCWHGSGGHLVLSCWSQCPPPMEPGLRLPSQEWGPGQPLSRHSPVLARSE